MGPDWKIVAVTGLSDSSVKKESRRSSRGVDLTKLSQPVREPDRSVILRSKICGEAADGPQARNLRQNARPAAAPDIRPPLSVREIEVMRHLRKGLLYKEIADKMGISFTAVHKLQHKIFVKLRVGNRTEAVNKWKSARSK